MTRKVPIIPIRGSVVFPRTDTLLSFGRPKSIMAVNAAFQGDRVVAVFTQKDLRSQDPDEKNLYQFGTIATVTQMMSTEGEIHALVRGQARIRLKKIVSKEPYLVGEVEEIPEVLVETDEIKVLSKQLQDNFKKAISLGKQAELMSVMKLLGGPTDPLELIDQIASVLEISTTEKQKILEQLDVFKRLKAVHEKLAKEVGAIELERNISIKTNQRFEDQMRKNILREKKRAIEQELGEFEEGDELGSDEVKEFKTRIKQAGMPPKVLEKAEKELKRLIQLNPNNPESGFLKNYLEWLCDMPWSKTSSSKVSMREATKILEKSHFAMDKVKERILEYLAVMKLKEEEVKKSKKSTNHPTILCFMGPPGVGKTSIGQSIAKALGREFVRMSLGGIRDEAEIRGHRRTYIGALPGRIIQSIKNAKTKNPVFMLDEIDKIGADFRGDPASALLEVLDPEQNKEFSDHFLEVPFDLSEVMFIATGNVLDTIPSALKDRMEVINFSGYTEEEKYQIAQKYLWPKQLKVHGLGKRDIKLTDNALKQIINRYTKEAGVRNLERTLAQVARKIARLVAEKRKISKKVEAKDLKKYLGTHKFTSAIAEKEDEIGTSTGLSVTPYGGEILFIEVSVMPGRGKLTLTGQLGDVMKESARAAFTWVKSHYNILGLKQNFSEKIDIHVHVPEGAVPKDGPSAGVSMTTALVSALTGIPVRKDVGMTGEITLRGRVMEIGGLKEKTIAGHRAGLKTIVAPKDNKKDLEEIPQKVKKDIEFVFAKKIEDVLTVTLTKWPVKVESKRKYIPMYSVLAAD